jgi:hypothetical protein
VGLEKQIAAAGRAVADSGGLGFRMTEGNSCFGGGKPGVSDALASALWAMDYMLYVASKGYVGVNLHGGGMDITRRLRRWMRRSRHRGRSIGE